MILAAAVQTDPVQDESNLSLAYSPRSMSVDRTPVVTPDRGQREEEDEAAFCGDTLSPIPVEGEMSGMDPSAVEALASVHRISPPDGDGDYEEAANSIASGSAFRAKLHAPEDEERDYRMAVHSPNSIEHLSHHLPRLKGCPGLSLIHI